MTERQRAELLALPVTEEEVVVRYSLDDLELKAVARLRSPANRLGYALQLSAAEVRSGMTAYGHWQLNRGPSVADNFPAVRQRNCHRLKLPYVQQTRGRLPATAAGIA